MGRIPSRCVRRALLGLCCALVTTAIPEARSGQRGRAEWDPALLQQWVTAVEAHSPGDLDSALVGAAAWTGEDLQRLWTDTQVLLELVVNPGRSRVGIPRMSFDPERRLRGQERMTVTVRSDERESLDPLAERVRRRGLNVVLHRAAILHTDIVTQAADLTVQAGATSAGGPLRWSIGDGTSVGAEGLNLHWEMARMTMARVMPDPRRDPFVRDWYRATVATGQASEYFDSLQLGEGLQLFPEDPELLLMKGAEREAMASPLFQAFARSVSNTVMMTGIRSVGRELGTAADFYRRALEANPQLAEARVRLGRVLVLQDRHEEAVRHLEIALDADLDPRHRYFALLFLGSAREGLGQLDAAIHAFEQAAARHESTRVPHLAIARIARERGDRTLVTASLDRALAPIGVDDAIDPWWLYRSAQGRRRAPWLDDVRRRAKEDRP